VRASQPSVEALVHELQSKEPAARERARKSLVEMRSEEVAAALVAELESPHKQVRWEAAKALVSLAEPSSAPALVSALEDQSEEVRWLASDALIMLGIHGVLAVLKALMRRARSSALCEGAHHVLRAIDHGPYAAIVAPVMNALHAAEPGAAAPPAAFHAWLAMETVLHAMQLAESRKPVLRWD
jgi:HEAT repeat protein